MSASAVGTVDTPRFAVTIDDETLVESSGRVTSLSVETSLDAASRFVVELAGRFDPATGRFTDLDPDRFELGAEATVDLGYDGEPERVFVGRVAGIRASFPADSAPTLEVSGYGPLHAMTRDSESESWTERTDSEVAADVVGDYDFDATVVEETGVTRRRIVQNGQNDYRFLQGLAARNGFECFGHLGTFYFRTPREDVDPALSLRYGDRLRSFTAERSDADDVAEVEVRHWDPKAKREIVGTAERETDGDARRVFRRPVDSPEEAERLAQAELERLARGTTRASGEATGLPELVPGEPVAITGVGSFGGEDGPTYYVRSVTHRVDARSGYRTSFEATEAMA
ncbi:MAG: contractile injection system protein, VgrG/Pvc8 family [Haloarculaceae archaeon]